MAAPNPLRPITQRLTSTAVEDLPRYAGFLAASILNNAESFRQAEAQKTDVAVTITKLKVRVSSLIQDKTVEGRYTGIVLIKAIIDAGGAQVLAASAPWTRNLLSCLNKPDPPEVKKLAIITLTRIFLLTRDSPSLLREITTPVLPTFMSTCFNLIRPLAVTRTSIERAVLNPLLSTVLQCWDHLIYDFSTTIKPNRASIRDITVDIISEETTPEATRHLAIQIFAKLHYCAPQKTSADEWYQVVEQAVEASHQSADVVLRSVLEEWTSVTSRQPTSIGSKASVEAKLKAPDALGLGRWRGIEAGTLRLASLMKILSALITEKQKNFTTLSLTSILDLVARCALVVPPSAQLVLRSNPEIGRDEREELWLHLPRLHAAATTLLNRLAATYGQTLRPASRIITSQVVDMFEASAISPQLRQASYEAVQTLIRYELTAFHLIDTSTLTIFVRACCSDTQGAAASTTDSAAVNGDAKALQRSSLSLTNPQPLEQLKTLVQTKTHVQMAAWNLLPSLIGHTSTSMSSSLRAEVDRTIIVAGHTEAILASILHPLASARGGVGSSASLLPFLSRVACGDVASEALLRPRMPVLRTTVSDSRAISASQNEILDEDAEPDRDVDMEAAADDYVSKTETQIDEEQPRLSEDSSQRKREFTALESDIQAGEGDQMKRARTDNEVIPLSQNHEEEEPVSTVLTELIDFQSSNHKYSTGLVSGNQYGAHDSNTEIHVPAPRTSESEHTSATQPSASQPMINSKQVADADSDDEDDDDEIPAIDATISDDDDEEDDEEETDEVE